MAALFKPIKNGLLFIIWLLSGRGEEEYFVYQIRKKGCMFRQKILNKNFNMAYAN